jgi:hypothetical protein
MSPEEFAGEGQQQFTRPDSLLTLKQTVLYFKRFAYRCISVRGNVFFFFDVIRNVSFSVCLTYLCVPHDKSLKNQVFPIQSHTSVLEVCRYSLLILLWFSSAFLCELKLAATSSFPFLTYFSVTIFSLNLSQFQNTVLSRSLSSPGILLISYQ